MLDGPLISSLDELFVEASRPSDNRYIVCYHKATHPRVVCSYQFATVAAMIRDQKLRWATLSPDYRLREGKSLHAKMLYGEPEMDDEAIF